MKCFCSQRTASYRKRLAVTIKYIQSHVYLHIKFIFSLEMNKDQYSDEHELNICKNHIKF